MQPRVIDIENRQFKANGKTFFIEVENMPTGRFQKFEQMGITFGFGSTFADIFSSFEKIYKAATSGNDILKANSIAQEVAYNQMHAIKRNDENYKPHLLWYCTVFCNYKDEDRTQWSEDVARQKISDWEKSPIPIQDFFLLASHALAGFQAAYNSLQQAKKVTPKAPSPSFHSKKAEQ